MTAKEIITSAMKKIGALAPGEAGEAHEIDDGLSVLNRMLNLWSAKRLFVYVTTQDSHALVNGTASYTIGSTGTIATTRPMKILSGFIRDSDSADTPLTQITIEEYNDLVTKTLTGRPEKIAYRPGYPNGTIYLYPTPSSGYTLYIESQKPLGELASATTSFSFPAEYEEAVIYNLAVRLAPDYGATVTPEVAGIAAEGYKTVRNMNTPEVRGAKTDIPPGSNYPGYVMDINRGY